MGRGSSGAAGGGGAGGSAVKVIQRDLTGDQAVDAVSKLNKGSVIELTYDTGTGITTNTYEYKSKYYSGLGHSADVWVRISGSGWQNDFAPNKSTLKSVFYNATVRIVKKK